MRACQFMLHTIRNRSALAAQTDFCRRATQFIARNCVFLAQVAAEGKKDPYNEAMKAFAMFDTDGSGTIDASGTWTAFCFCFLMKRVWVDMQDMRRKSQPHSQPPTFPTPPNPQNSNHSAELGAALKAMGHELPPDEIKKMLAQVFVCLPARFRVTDLYTASVLIPSGFTATDKRALPPSHSQYEGVVERE